MAAFPGPDRETWKKMSSLARKVYCAVVIAVFMIICAVWLS